MRLDWNGHDILNALYGSLAELGRLGLLYDVMPLHTLRSPTEISQQLFTRVERAPK